MSGMTALGREPDQAKALRKTWGRNIKETRELRGMSRAELAAAVAQILGPDATMSEQSVGYWERGETAPRWHVQIAIADALNCAHGVIFVMRAA